MCKASKVIKSMLAPINRYFRGKKKDTVVGIGIKVDRLKDYQDIRLNDWLNPNDIRTQGFHRDVPPHEYVSIMTLSLQRWANADREIAKVHKSMGGPIMLITTIGQSVLVSGVHVREASDRKKSNELIGRIKIVPLCDTREDHEFLESLNVAYFPKTGMRSFYDGWLDRLDALVESLKDPGFCWDRFQRPHDSVEILSTPAVADTAESQADELAATL